MVSASTTTLPSAPLRQLCLNVVLQPPLSRSGHGPGLVIIRSSVHAACQANNNTLDPEPIKKWAEESFAVAQVTLDAEASQSEELVWRLLVLANDGLLSLAECDNKEKVGLLVYGSAADYSAGFNDILRTILSTRKYAAGVYFDRWKDLQAPALFHLDATKSLVQDSDTQKFYSYPEVSSSAFIFPGHADFNIASAGVVHTRSVTFIKKHLGGPYFDLEKIWDEHTYYEFADRSVEKTMATMVQEPYVNHVPTLTGGIGRAKLSKFYLNHFIFNNPDDTKLELISRTVGVDRVVDEFIFCLTHNKIIDWLLPGIPPTGKPLRIPFTSVVNIRGDRLYHEHIAWDQATVLIQLGLMPEYLPFPYPLADGRTPAPGKRFEYRVPAAGVETADKLQNEHLVESNEMFKFEVREVDDK
ncbi:uncharacterized protein BDV17DRAFT_233383 [Aspergillus undulatus]|uniref:uncharacterized protein n=1 Tax=Aspergillus undulatus TaxID=1810928 RepID=UPI003CCDC0CD